MHPDISDIADHSTEYPPLPMGLCILYDLQRCPFLLAYANTGIKSRHSAKWIFTNYSTHNIFNHLGNVGVTIANRCRRNIPTAFVIHTTHVLRTQRANFKSNQKWLVVNISNGFLGMVFATKKKHEISLIWNCRDHQYYDDCAEQ